MCVCDSYVYEYVVRGELMRADCYAQHASCCSWSALATEH
jgi:hypothetical protein